VKITIESTDAIVALEVNGKDVPARVWEGKTDSGIPVVCLVTRISPQTHDAEANAVFARELIETRKPILPGPWERGIPLRMIL
jgi:hypothetical protein